MDFGASLTHTHHKESIYSFADLLKSNERTYEIWIPKGSEIVSEEFQIMRFLIPGFNPASFKLRQIRTWIPGIHGKIHNLANKYGLNLVLRMLVFLNAFHFLILLKRKIPKYKKINLIFTTVCGFSLRSLYLLESKKFKVNSFCRLTNTAERRGNLSNLITVQDFIEVSKNFKYVNTRFGTETLAYLRKLGLTNDVRGFISKFPAQQKVNKKEIDPSKLTFSFLGYPTRDKGQENVVPIVREATKRIPNIKWKVQVFESDPIIFELRKLSEEIEILQGKISSSSMDEALQESALICLPYNPTAFAFNSSAMMYQAADFLVPIITFEGTAFAEEVQLYGCGFVASNLEDMIERICIVEKEMIDEWINGCLRYNLFRNDSNSIFLNLKSK